jgi:hypothetical protein
MTPGDLVITVEFTTEADEKTAYLSGLYAGSGVISPDFARDNYDYTIAVPFGAEEFSISAQAENPYLEPELRQVSPESGDKELDDELTLTEGLNEYTITVTSQDGSATKEYRIKAVKLPDLSLKTFTITNNKDSFERDLAPFDTQSVYVSYADGIKLVAEAAAGGALVNISPANIPSLKVDVPTAVTVTVSKDFSGVDTSLTAKNYILNLYYGDGVPPNPLAEGGIVSFIPAETPGSYYEVHTFLESGMMSFFDKSAGALKADILIVAGGGGAGNASANDCAGGGGAGGVLYKTGETLPLTSDSVSVTVGAGGGGDGKDSSIGLVSVPGGGGGGNTGAVGKPGGSGGGGGANNGTYFSLGGAGADTLYADIKGYGGGNGDTGIAGGGGGGAGGKGVDGGAGGAPWVPDGEAAWVTDVVGVNEFSRGGNGGNGDGGPNGAAGRNYGDGGSGGQRWSGKTGGAGHAGIVRVRFPHQGNANQ